MATAEVRAIRQEIDDITRKARILQEVNEIHKEIAAIRQAVEALQKQHEAEKQQTKPSPAPTATQPTQSTTPTQSTPAPTQTPAKTSAPPTTSTPAPAPAAQPTPAPAAQATPAPAAQPAPTPAAQPTPAPATTTTQPTQSAQPKSSPAPASTPATQPAKQTTTPAPAPTKTTATPTKTTVTPAKTTTAPAAKTTVAPSNSNTAPKKTDPDFTPDKHIEERMKQEQAESDALLSAKTKQVEAPEFSNYGMDADIAKRMKDKYDPQLEAQAKDWIEQVTGEKITGPFFQALKSGVILCNLLNKLKPNTIKRVNKMNMPFAHMENIQAFLQGAAGLGLPTADSFMTVDLYEEKNINQVVLAIHSLGRHSRKIQGYTGPSIGPKLADKHEVNFTDEQLKKGQTELNYSQSVQKESQKIASEATKPQMDSIVRTKQTGAPK